MVYAYFTAALANANVTWLWIDPGGQLFLNQTQQLQCDVSPCTFVYYFSLRHTDAAAKFGLWTLTLRAGGINLYSDYFSVISVILQDNYWNFEVTQSEPPRVHGDLIVTIHPSNGTWSSYLVYLPFATNITAYEFPSKRTLDVVASNKTGRVVVDLGAERSDGYRFALSFDLVYGLHGLPGGVFVFDWQESGWGTFSDGYHSVPGSFNITLPAGATFLDIAGINAMTLNPNLRGARDLQLGLEQLSYRVKASGGPCSIAILTHDNSNPNSGPLIPWGRIEPNFCAVNPIPARDVGQPEFMGGNYVHLHVDRLRAPGVCIW